MFVSGKYVIQWKAPSNNGGDSSCCGYDWQVCTLDDKTCSKPVDSGSVKAGSPLKAYTSKVDWGVTYNVMVRANNKYGDGPWSTAQLKAGGGVFQTIVMAEKIGQSGNIIIPASSTSKNLMIWASISPGQSKGAGNLAATATLTQIRNGKNVDRVIGVMTSGTYNGQDTFVSDFETLDIIDGDIFDVYIYVVDSTKQPFTDGEASITVTGSVPGAVGGITFSYEDVGYGAGEPVLISCSGDLNYINSLAVGPNGSLAAASAAAGKLVNNPDSQYKACTPIEKGMYLMWVNALPPSDPTRSCDTALKVTDGMLTSPAEQCGAWDVYSTIDSEYGNTDCQNNPIIAKWSNACKNV